MSVHVEAGARRRRTGRIAVAATLVGALFAALWLGGEDQGVASTPAARVAQAVQPPASSSHSTDAVLGVGGGITASANRLLGAEPTDGVAECANPVATGRAAADNEHDIDRPHLLPVVERLRHSAAPAAQAVSLLLGDPAAWEAEAWRRQRERVARAALQTQDPRLYELALRACSRLRTDLPDPQDSCSLLSRDRLLQLDPGNAAAWLRKLAAAMAEGDEAAAADALYHAAVARRYTHWSSDAARIAASAMTGEAAQQRYAVWRSLTAIAQIDARLLVAPLLAQCGTARLADANRRQLCTAVDDVLLDHSDSVDTTLPGLVVGWQLGRSGPELAPYLERNDWLNQARRVQPDPRGAGCRDAATWAAVMQASLSARSPWSAMRAALDSGGWPTDRLQHRAATLDAAALGDEDTPRAAAPRRAHGHVEILGDSF